MPKNLDHVQLKCKYTLWLGEGGRQRGSEEALEETSTVTSRGSISKCNTNSTPCARESGSMFLSKMRF